MLVRDALSTRISDFFRSAHGGHGARGSIFDLVRQSECRMVLASIGPTPIRSGTFKKGVLKLFF